MARHCGRNTSALLRALLDTESRQCHAVLRRVRNEESHRHLNSCGILSSQCTQLPLFSPVHTQKRTFLSLAVPILGSKRMDYTESKVLGYSIGQMFDVVANVEDYKMFVPWCKRSKVLSRRNGVTCAELEVGFPPITEKYVSEISVIPQRKIRAVCNDGKLFSYLETVWQFSPGISGRPDTCTLDFYVSFEFKSLLHSHLATVFFDEVAKQMVTAFESQAARIYGKQIKPLRATKLRAVQ
ncbi:coenzyme Q-binding protein COQ10 homolog B, mitochondrial-like [Pseudophryne corroboree]|uniref:coenzyme Q-binding protein COQ10 homolog B, mitochondrial-like n=1 Tax=Pseudophryne corroboree TaxID=495146 RepID=UPI0030817109